MKLPAILDKELSFYYKLNPEARILLNSFVTFSLAAPLLDYFVSAFLWQSIKDFNLILLFRLVLYACLPFCFLLNGVLLSFLDCGLILAVGLIGNGLAVSYLFFSESIIWQNIVVFALLYSVACALYWANRNFLTLYVTKVHERKYFSSIEVAISTLLSVIMPLLYGWSIELGKHIPGATKNLGYKVLILGATLVLTLVAVMVRKITVHDFKPKSLVLRNATSLWKKMRLLLICFGITDVAARILPILIVLYVIEGEGKLGSLISLAAVFSAIAVYASGKMSGHSLGALRMGVGSIIVGAFIYCIFFSTKSAVVLLILQTFGTPFLFASLNPLIYSSINHDNTDSSRYYAYIMDRELFLNLGRIIAIILILLPLHYFSLQIVLRSSPALFVIPEIILVGFAAKIAVDVKQ